MFRRQEVNYYIIKLLQCILSTSISNILNIYQVMIGVKFEFLQARSTWVYTHPNFLGFLYSLRTFFKKFILREKEKHYT